MLEHDHDDDALFTAAGKGDQIAFNRLVQRHAPRIHAVARRYGCGAADADEIVQDTFWSAWNAAGRWKPGTARVSTWLYKVAVNRTIDHHRRARRRMEESIDEDWDPTDETATAEHALGDRQRLDAVRHAIADLPERQRMAIILSAQQGKSNREIADIFGISEGAAEQLIFRARRALRETHRRLE